MTTPAPICWGCRHFHEDNTCRAFPRGIPKPILIDRADHTKPYPGDRGIQFEPKKSGAYNHPTRRPQ